MPNRKAEPFVQTVLREMTLKSGFTLAPNEWAGTMFPEQPLEPPPVSRPGDVAHHNFLAISEVSSLAKCDLTEG